MRFIVTGASGMTGHRLVELLVARHGAAAVVALTSPRPTAQESGRNGVLTRLGVRQIRADLLAPGDLKDLPDFDAVYHLAAELNIELTDGREGAPMRVNDTGTANLIAALGARLKDKLFVYTSSIAVVDRPGLDAAVTEESPCRPRTLYGRTKLRGEEIVKAEAARLGFRWSIFRLGTVYGPNCRENHVFDRFARWAAADAWQARVDWPGKLSLIFVDDAAEILLDALSRPEALSETFFLANPEEATIGGMVREIRRALGKERGLISVPASLAGFLSRVLDQDWFWERMPGPVAANAWRLSLILSNGFQCDMSKLRRAFPEKSFAGFREGVSRALRDNAIMSTAQA